MSTTQRSVELEQLEAACRRHRLPLTVQRRAILEALVGRDDHPTADDIFEAVRGRLPELSRTTVYRVLDTLVRLGVAMKISHPAASTRFDARTERHHHLVCVHCEKVMDLDAPALSRLSIPDTRSVAFEISDYSVHFRGTCGACRRSRGRGASAIPAPPARRGRARRRRTMR